MQRSALIQEIVETMAKCQRPANLSSWEKFPLSHAQVGMLYMLSYHQESSVKQVAEYLGVSLSAVSQLLEPLITKGLIDRHSDKIDRRVARLSLTKQGLQTLGKVNKLKYANFRSRLDSLNTAELGQLSGLVRRLAGATESVS